MTKLVVVGSVNMDIVTQVTKLPVPGETVKGLNTAYYPGGKGANQAVAAAMAGAEVAFVGAVGDDAYGPRLLVSLQEKGVRTGAVLHKQVRTGIAYINVDAAGENHIILSEGANGKLTPEDIADQSAAFDNVHGLLTQNEIPWETTVFALKLARSKGVFTCYNPAPVAPVPSELWPLIDLLVVNEHEAAQLTGLTADLTDEAARQAVEALLAQGADAVLLTLGEQGSLYADRRGEIVREPVFKVKAVDTTAAGDTFIGSFLTARLAGQTVRHSLRFASAASAIAVSRAGAQASIPDHAEIEAYLSEHAV
ncbi:Ribokinase [Paenibacillus konkukensis]|uniref:Ribokinase n=1 Tax=Paenibacillus konkukensis TaxID=2020716 RepID=A0ABY4RJA7_9BACL|nr:ribokinase [Paenibacillus konkukensis]UQZ82200.1 Ribokinase [Paenibacillus konkukensis]